MPYKITNVSLDHQHALKRRMSPRIQMEPVIAGKRLLLRQSIVLTDEQYLINKDIIAQCVRDGTVTFESTMPFIPLKMPPEVYEDKIRGVTYDSVAVDEAQDLAKEAPTPPLPVEEAPVSPAVINQPTTAQPAYSPQSGNYPQRRDDKKRGGR